MGRRGRIGRAAAYVAAAALVPYLVIKVSWVAGSSLGLLPVPRGFSLAGWLVLNVVTIGMAAVGIMLGLALVRPWGMRIPGRLVGLFAWVGAGFLVSILPFVAVTALVDSGTGSPDSPESSTSSGSGAAMPGWEAVLLQSSFVVTGIALAVALPAYVLRRWPHVLRPPEQPGTAASVSSGSLWSSGPSGSSGSTGSVWPAAAAAVTGLAWLYWAAGGTLGIAHRDERTADWHVLVGVSACWALAAAAAVPALGRGRSGRLGYPLLLASAWLGSGSMFAWSGWKFVVLSYVALADPSGAGPPENLAVAAALHVTAVLAGAGILRASVRTGREPAGGPHRAAVA